MAGKQITYPSLVHPYLRVVRVQACIDERLTVDEIHFHTCVDASPGAMVASGDVTVRCLTFGASGVAGASRPRG